MANPQISRSLNMRTTIGIYRQLGHYLDTIDAEYTTAQNSSKPLTDPAVDAHFRSGVYLGVGMCNITLSLMPGKLMTLVELFGYHGDRKVGLEMLMRVGGWEDGVEEPRVSTGEPIFFVVVVVNSGKKKSPLIREIHFQPKRVFEGRSATCRCCCSIWSFRASLLTVWISKWPARFSNGI